MSGSLKLFPRALALAEAAWSPRARRDYRSLAARIMAHLPRLAALQLDARYPDGIEFRHQGGILTLEPELPEARIHVTLNGPAPAASDPIYTAPIPVTPPALVRAAIVLDDGTLGRAKSYLACDLIDSRRLSVVRATASHPDHPATVALAASNRAFWLTASPPPPFPHEMVFDLGEEEAIASFIYESRADGVLDGNILEYELLISGGGGPATAAHGVTIQPGWPT